MKTKTSFLYQAIERPQLLQFRRALFQVHLWTGVGLGLYILIISISGAAIVFQDEMETSLNSQLTQTRDAAGPQTDIASVMRNANSAYPDFRLRSISLPTEMVQTFSLELRRDADKKQLIAYAHPATAVILGHRGREGSVLEWLNDLHHNLLAGKTGRLVNGFGGIFLGLLCATGVVIWWPGIKNWKRGMKVDFGKKWKRVNWDLHSAVGFWALLLISLWAVTGAYFTWSNEIRSAINSISPLSQPKSPESNLAMKGLQAPPDIDQLIARAKEASPNTRLSRISFPDNDKGVIRILMARGEIHDRRYTDNFYFDQFTGGLLHIWNRGIHRSAGDVIVYWISPLHFGDFGGVGVKILWVVLGLAPAALFVTGSLMWWNRVLSKKWARLKASRSEEMGVSTAGRAAHSEPHPKAAGYQPALVGGDQTDQN
jgi:uncharacterized iron-regulated membrane protein